MELTLSINNNPNNILNTDMTLGKINFDVDLVKERIKEYLSKYEGLIVKEEDIKEIKSEVAFLRKQKKLIDKNRIDFSKEFDKPLVTYKENCDSIMDEIEKVIVYLNSQLNDFEDKRKEEKRVQVENLMNKIKLIRNMPDDFDFNFEDRYLNATLSMSKIQDELIKQCNQYETMKHLEKEMEENLKAKKILLEDIINKINSQISFEKRFRYTDYENIINEIETDKLESYMLNELQKKLGTKSKVCEIEEEQIEEVKEDDLEEKTYSFKMKINKIELEHIKEYLNNMQIDFEIETLEENNNFDNEFDISA